MVKAEQVPEEVVAAAAKELADKMLELYDIYVCEPIARDIVASAINAWPGAAVCHYTIEGDEGYEMVLPLPFPQETNE